MNLLTRLRICCKGTSSFLTVLRYLYKHKLGVRMDGERKSFALGIYHAMPYSVNASSLHLFTVPTGVLDLVLGIFEEEVEE
jgi:hypothetical protein